MIQQILIIFSTDKVEPKLANCHGECLGTRHHDTEVADKSRKPIQSWEDMRIYLCIYYRDNYKTLYSVNANIR